MKDEIVKEWFERGRHDFETAKILINNDVYYDVIMFLLEQAVEKYIKGYLIFNGWKLKKIHDIEMLLTEAMEFDRSFEKYLDAGRMLIAFYYETRYPPGPIPEISREEVVKILNLVEEVISKIRSEVDLKD